MKAVVAAFNQEKALVGAFSVITNIRMQLFEALSSSLSSFSSPPTPPGIHNKYNFQLHYTNVPTDDAVDQIVLEESLPHGVGQLGEGEQQGQQVGQPEVVGGDQGVLGRLLQ